jgi:hypothetical protein
MTKMHVDFWTWSWEYFNNVLSKVKPLTNNRCIAICSVTCGKHGLTLKLYSNYIISISLCHTLVFNEPCQLLYKQQIKLTCGSYSFYSCAKLVLRKSL